MLAAPSYTRGRVAPRDGLRLIDAATREVLPPAIAPAGPFALRYAFAGTLAFASAAEAPQLVACELVSRGADFGRGSARAA